MRLAAVRRLRGPNSYLPRPALVGRVHLGELADLTPVEHPALAELPGLAAGPPASTGIGHIVEHVMRELSARIGREVTAGRIVAAESGACDIVTDCPPEEPADSVVGERLLRLALDLVDAHAAGRTAPDIDERLAVIRRDYVRESLGPSTAALAAAARERDIPVQRIGALDLLRLGSGRHRRLVGEAMTDGTSAVGVAVSRDRALTRQFLADLGLPVPPVSSVEGLPPGRDYRVLVVAGSVVRATEWRPNDAGSGPAEAPGDLTGDVHPDVAELCRRVAAAAGLDIAGIDLRLPSIAAPLPPAGPDGCPTCVVTDLFTGPDLRLGGTPGSPPDASHEAARAVVAALYPPGAPARIPTVAVTGGAAETTARLVSHLLGEGGRRVGLAGGSGVWVADRPVECLPGDQPRAAQLVLGDPTVDVAVLVVDPAAMCEAGLGYDSTDVAVIMSGEPAMVESIVAGAVRDGGTLVLRAGPRTAELAADPAVRAEHKRVVLFDLDPASPAVRQHLNADGCAYVLDAGWLTQLRDCYKARVVPLDEVPGAAGSPAEQRVAALAAVAAAAANGLSPATIRRRLAALIAPECVKAATVLRFDASVAGPAGAVVAEPSGPAVAARQAA
ncbi:MAG TPA: hypothetical protein VFR67_01305 [Pilimelia sp.]|nr:hypothetical protein [Pilimelia sp.]